jgi:hypothetical protein
MKTTVMFKDKNNNNRMLAIPESWDKIPVEDVIYNVSLLKWFKGVNHDIYFNSVFIQSFWVIREEGVFHNEEK